MGACVSHHHHNKAYNSEMKKKVPFNNSYSNDNIKQHYDQNKAVITDHNSSTSNYNNNTKLVLTFMDGHVAVKPQLPPSHQSPATFSDHGSKEETFFDSQAWLDSDCEDEFMSVNGEFTPSRGNTPVHPSLTLGKPHQVIGGVTFMEKNDPFVSKPQPSPTPTQKKFSLLELFKRSIRDNRDLTEVIAEPPNKDGHMETDDANLKQSREAHLDSRQSGCFSSLLSVRSTGRQKKKSLNVAQSAVFDE
uniref:uncharacterized protein LOC122579743 n=1 Tax=Erigeron canadensis TaxID=72917 RepID=UPI001CB8A002|nr:uncharacterized protein LOC122579743 [Erigeron canadensis]